MKKRLIIAALVLATTRFVAQAVPPLETPLAVMVSNNNLIVVGTLTNGTITTTNGYDFSSATIVIHEVLKGTPRTSQVRLSWRDKSDLICPREPHWSRRGKESIWFLRSTNGVDVTAEYYGAQAVTERDEVMRLLREKR